MRSGPNLVQRTISEAKSTQRRDAPPQLRLHVNAGADCTRRQIIVGFGAFKFSVCNAEELEALKQRVRSAYKTKEGSSIRLRLFFNGRPVHDERTSSHFKPHCLEVATATRARRQNLENQRRLKPPKRGERGLTGRYSRES